jgi:uncharacterized repeat protein (TIGR03803 family)
MPNQKTLASMIAVLTVICGFLTAAPALAASKEKVLYSFKNNGTDGTAPYAGLLFDGDGNLYGTTALGGTPGSGCKNEGCDTVFQLAPGAKGTWTEKVLYSFQDNGTDGFESVANLIFDTSGNLYGTTAAGGGDDAGTAFELTPGSAGTWSETVLYSFNDNHVDGYNPYAGLVFDAAGNLYGTTHGGGGDSRDGGTVFQLIPDSGTWTEAVLYSFGTNGHDGGQPYAGLTFDDSGNLYSTVSIAGDRGGGAVGSVFQLTPGGDGSWTEKILYGCGSKGCPDQGGDAHGNVIFGPAGKIYSTTSVGGAYLKPCGGVGCGTVFQLTPKSGGKWTEEVIHSFGKGKDGEVPQAGVVRDASGRLYGTTLDGGAHGGGTVFQLTPGANGTWSEKVLHSFGKGKDGASPYTGLILDAAGNLYGTTSQGGAHNSGTVFEIIP